MRGEPEMSTGLVDDAHVPDDRPPVGVPSMASVIDAGIALATAITLAAASTTAVIATAMERGGASPPSTLEGIVLYVAFPVFEVLVFTPVGPVSAGLGIGVGVLCWLARLGALPVRSPGMRLTGSGRRAAKGRTP
jgi:hypothetical protein